eukprot:157526-Prorocentrum_lima.AAC.1
MAVTLAAAEGGGNASTIWACVRPEQSGSLPRYKTAQLCAARVTGQRTGYVWPCLVLLRASR